MPLFDNVFSINIKRTLYSETDIGHLMQNIFSNHSEKFDNIG